jgi:hypothetical protein
MIGLLLNPVTRYLAGAAAIVAILGGIYWKGHNDGSHSVETRIAAERAEAIAKRLEIERDAAPCLADPDCLLSDPFRVPAIRPDPGK